MRTTLDLDDDVLAAVKGIAAATGRSAGATASELIRRTLHEERPLVERDGLLFFPTPQHGVVVTNELIDRLLDELP
jgi:hypothetical protein